MTRLLPALILCILLAIQSSSVNSAVVGGGGGGAETPDTIESRSKVSTTLNSFANSRRWGDGSDDFWAVYTHPTDGPILVPACGGVENDCHRYTKVGSGKNWGLKNSSGNIQVEVQSAVGRFTVFNTHVEDPAVTIKMPFKHNFKMVGCAGATGTLLLDTNATLAPTATCTAGSTNGTLIMGYAVFPDSDGEYQLQDSFQLPSDFGASDNIDVDLYWRTAATSGSVVIQVATFCTSNAEVEDTAWNTASTVTDAALGTTLQLNLATITNLTKTNCAARDYFHIKFMRQRTHASDDLANTFQLRNAELTIRRDT